jgi:hypothetical protein
MSRVEDGPPKPCGAKHPRYEGVTCERIGACWGGSPHMGVITDPRKTHGEQRRFVYWGGASERIDKHFS